jgi:hypothetical protein
MATFIELYTRGTDGGPLLQKVAAACVIQANTIRTETPPANSAARLAWARKALADPVTIARQMLWVVLAQNSAATLATIDGATDATILTAVAAAIDLVAG